MAEINCPMCGKPNPAERDICQYCEARLKPLTDELSRSQPPIRPGEEPKEVDTGQLESALPKWLRDIRQQARESAGEEPEQPPKEEEARPQKPKADLLAGLRSKSEEEEEIPSWLAGLRGEGGAATFEESPPADDDMAALRSMLGDESPAPQDEEDNALPDWMADLGSGATEQTESDRWSELREDAAQGPTETDQPLSASDSDFKWDADFGSDSPLQSESAESEQPFDTELPAWLKDTSEAPEEGTDTGLPGWLSGKESPAGEDENAPLSVEGDFPAWLQDKDEPQQEEFPDTGLPAWLSDEAPAAPSQGEGGASSGASDLSDWLASLGKEETGTDEPSVRSTTDWLASLDEERIESEPSGSYDSTIKSTTDWLASLDESSTEETGQQEPIKPAAEGEIPDWLSSLGEEETEQGTPQAPEETAAATDLPDWLAVLGEESAEVPPEEAQPLGESETPAWLSSLGEESGTGEEEISAPADEYAEPLEPATGAEIPDWLATIGEATEGSEKPAEEEEIEAPSYSSEEQAGESGVQHTFVDDEGQPISTEDVDAIFSMGMPDWLSDVQREVREGTEPISEGEPGDELRPAELPSWVQAMRPVESVITEADDVHLEDQPVEERGPLAGLHGVLPAVTGIGPSSKPKAYSIKLQASEDQQASAALLERLLAEEVNPEPVIAQKAVLTQNLLRWVIAVLVLLVVGAGVFLSPQINPVPSSVPPETSDVLEFVQNALPANAPVLMVFDYEAARTGEMEVAAAPLIDQMLTLKSPRISLVSSTPTGSGLAERFMHILLVERPYARNENFVNLGYLPGGAAGVQAFAGNPVTTKQLTTTGEAAWSTPALQGVNDLSGFAAIFLLTDDVETARVWIEQTEGHRGDARLLVISSAQSGPMLRPYERSGQVLGMVTGLDNSAPIEQANSGRPGMARRYWDAYGFGLLAAAVMITIGSLWSLVSGLQASRKGQGKK